MIVIVIVSTHALLDVWIMSNSSTGRRAHVLLYLQQCGMLGLRETVGMRQYLFHQVHCFEGVFDVVVNGVQFIRFCLV